LILYPIKNGKVITIKQATYALVCRHINRMRRHTQRSCDIDLYLESLSVDIDHYKEKDYTKVDNTISRLGLTTVEQETLDCYMGGMSCKEIADFLDIDRVTVWRRRQRLQVKYKALFPTFN
jgi:transposase-like protein